MLSRRSKITVTPINGISKFTKLYPAGKTQEIVSNLLTDILLGFLAVFRFNP